MFHLNFKHINCFAGAAEAVDTEWWDAPPTLVESKYEIC